MNICQQGFIVKGDEEEVTQDIVRRHADLPRVAERPIDSVLRRVFEVSVLKNDKDCSASEFQNQRLDVLPAQTTDDRPDSRGASEVHLTAIQSGFR